MLLLLILYVVPNFPQTIYTITCIHLGRGLKSMANFVESWSPFWKKKNEEFKAFVKYNPNLSFLSRKMFRVWDGNHGLQA